MRAVSVGTKASQLGWQGQAHRGQPDLPAVQRLGSRSERTGQGDAHATCRVLLESSMLHTGDFVRDVKVSGQEAREPPTKRQDPHEESEGA